VAKTAEAFRNIGEVSEELGVKKHVLRFWEMKFPQLKPMKRGGGRRLYRPVDVELLKRIRDLLQTSGYTIKGVQKLLRERGIEHVASAPDSRAAPRQRAARRPAAAAATLQLSSLEVGALRMVVAELAACHALLAQSRPDHPVK
jgi:DNA-binding transcriptional MerR regulator